MPTVALIASAAVPTTTPAALGCTSVNMGTAIVIFGAVATAAGDAQLWRWESAGAVDGTGAWYPYGAAFAVDPAALSGKYLQRYSVDKDNNSYFYLQLPTGATSNHAWIRGARL